MTSIVSLSGGKDSVALWLWALRTGLRPVAVYVDTGWEWAGHHLHLDMLEARLAVLRDLREEKADLWRERCERALAALTSSKTRNFSGTFSGRGAEEAIAILDGREPAATPPQATASLPPFQRWSPLIDGNNVAQPLETFRPPPLASDTAPALDEVSPHDADGGK